MFVSRPTHPSVRGQHSVLVGYRWRRVLRLLLAFALMLGSLPLQFTSVAFAAGIIVTTTADTIDAAGTCPAVTLGSLPGPDGQISLREAVCAANTNAGADTITFSVNGTFALTGAANEDNGGSGDLDVKQSLAVQGNGVSNTIIDGSGIERIFDVFPSAASTFDLSNLTVQNGDTRSTSFKEGGALYLHNNVTSTFNRIQVINNFSGANAAIENRGTLTINNSVVSNNQTIPASGSVTGGGIRSGGPLTIDNTTIANNSVRGEGGGIFINMGAAVTANITNSTISGNTASVTGGGLGNGGGISTTGNQGTINITNSTISGNHADNNGGGAYFITPGGGTGNATLTNVTISNNTADNDNNGVGAGGGFAQNTAAVTLRNMIVAGNLNSTAATRDDISGTVVASSSYNLIGDGTGMSGMTNGTNNNQVGSGASPVDPLLGPLVNNGGSTETHALLGGSPALDTGNNAVCPAADQRGVPRPGGAVCDKGSYELNDTTPPDTTITGNPANPSNSTSGTFTFTGSDNVTPAGSLTFQCQLDGGGFSACTSPRTYTGLADGSHTFQVRAVDGAGNTDPTPASYTWVVDATGPNTTITANPTNPSASTSAGFSFTGNDGSGTGVASFQCQLDGGGFSTCTSPQSYSGLSQGSHTFQVRAIDAVGNPDTTPATYTWVVDTVAPDTTLTATPTDPSASANASFSFTGSDPGGSGVAGFECQLDGGAFTACTSPQTYSGLSDGNHTFQVRAVDAAGNSDSTPAGFTWVVDTTEPDTTITANPTNPSASANASFSFTGSDPGGSGVASFECQLDSGGFGACTSPQTYTGLSDGSHTFQVRAIDAAGTADSTPASYTWVVDTTAPDTTITANPANPSASANASFSFTGSDPGGSGVASFECQLDGTGFTACTSPQTYSGLSDGSHTFQVRAIDAAGNTDSTPASFIWLIDTTAPTVAFSSAAPDPTNVSPIPVTVTFSENVTGFTAADITTSNGTVNNFAGSGSVYTFDLALAGQGLVTADIAASAAQDVAGNFNSAATQFSRTYDSIAPTVTIDRASGQADPTGTAPISFTVVFNEPVTGFGDGAADVTITGTAGATTATVTGSGTTYNVAIIGMTGPGTVVATIPAGAAQDLATNPSVASISTDNSVDFDPIVPVVTGIVRADPSPTSAASVQYTLTFAKAVTGVDASDFSFTTAGVSGASVTGVTGSGTTWTITVNTGSGDGTLRLDLVDDDTIVDGAGNKLGGTGAGNGNFTGGQAYTIDKTVPSVASIVRAGVNPTNAATVDFTVTFSEIVTGVDTADFGLTNVGITGAAITGVTGSGTTWTVSVSTGSGSGSIRLDVVDNDSIVDAIGNQLGGTGTGNGSFTSGEVYQIDKIAPTASNLVTAAVTPGSSVYTFTLDYADNLALDSASLGNGTVRVTGPNGFDQLATFASASPSGNGTPLTATYQISAPGGTWDSADNGVYNVAIVGNQVRDTAGNALAATPLGSFSIAAGYKTYLSLVLGNPGLPDLVVDQISATSTGIQVVIHNQGSAPVNDAFWVDVYINPTTVPTKVNQIWQALGAQGAVWGVTAGALPIAPGGTLTLTLGGAYYRPDLSNVPQSLAPGTQIFAQVDSANATTTYGAVLETHEQTGGTYNNISSVVVLAGLRLVPPMTISAPNAQPREQLPAREPHSLK